MTLYYLRFLKLCSDLDTFQLYLYSFSHYPEDVHMTGRYSLVTTIQ